MSKKDNSVILVGLDGIDRGEISEWLDDGKLQALRSVQESGSYTDLESTHPPWTPCAWPSLLSGRNPGKHGVFDFYTREEYEKRLIERTDVDAPYLFEAADSQGKTCLSINYPVTHPATKLEHGAVVPGYLANEDVTFYPRSLRKEYEAKYGEYIIYPEYGSKTNPVEEYVSVARCRRDMARFLDSQYDWDLLAVQFQVTDSVFHDLDNQNQIRQVIQKVDDFVGDILELGDDDTTVLVASDHGMGDYDWTFYINSWLADQGYCKTKKGEEEYFGQQKAALRGTEETSDGSSIAERGVSTLSDISSQIGISPKQIHKILTEVGLAKYIERVLPTSALIGALNQVVDRPNSTAYQLYFNSLGVHLNVEGRDPSGMVPQKEYATVREDLMDQLRTIHDPDGNKVFDKVLPREEIYSGDHLEDAPDILLIPREYRYDVSGSLLDTFRRYPHKNHKPNGVLFTSKPILAEENPRIYDVAPTVAAELGIPIDTLTDGEVLIDAKEEVRRESWDELTEGYRSNQSGDDMSSVEDRLANLGYME